MKVSYENHRSRLWGLIRPRTCYQGVWLYASSPSVITIFLRTTMMRVRNSKNTSIFIQTDSKKMTDASLWGPKRPEECLLRLIGLCNYYVFVINFTIFIDSGQSTDG